MPLWVGCGRDARGDSLSVGPRIYHVDPTPFEVAHVSRCDRCPQGASDRRDLAVGVVDGMPSSTARSAYHGVGLGGIAVEGENASCEVFPKHSLDLGKQPLAALTCR